MDLKKAIGFHNQKRHNSVASGFSLQKARSGVYADTPENRSLNRVGQKYGNPGKEDEESDKRPAKKEDPTKKKVAKTEEEKKPSTVAKPENQGAKKPAGQEQPQVGGHEIAQLTHLKSLLDSNPDKAYEIYQTLTPEAQAVVPQDVVNKLVSESHKEPEAEEGVNFDTIDKKGEEKIHTGEDTKGRTRGKTYKEEKTEKMTSEESSASLLDY